MTPRAQEIFEQALDHETGERDAFAQLACGSDQGLLEEVRSLLRAHAAAGPFLRQPTLNPPPESPGEPSPSADGPDDLAADSEARIGGTIGPFKLIEVLGEGGFGRVFLAEQREPVFRRVALKIIKLGMDTRQVVGRFELERQALAIMEHPNIARVLEAGATPLGRPYFVMELVRGEPITDYCDRLKLGPRQRLELFLPICRGVQHAHQKGIIHRDLKPGNVLVAMEDGKPVPKIIDFGIAKATAAEMTVQTAFTGHRVLVGTPAYMSPEQADPGVDIDTRTDIYSLGVLLYELLTGSTPFDTRELLRRGYAEIQRIIREVEPPKPSTRLSESGELLTEIAARRGTEARKLGTAIRGELDWIVMKALEKERHRRYESAGSFAEDVQRYLSGEPIAAAPPSRAYRARKFLRRHRVASGVATAIALSLTLGLAGTLWQYREARHQRDEARAEFRRAEAVTQFVLDAMTSQDVYESGDDEITVAEAMEQAIQKLGRGDLKDDPRGEARLRRTIAEILIKNRRAQLGLELAKQALAAEQALHPAAPPATAADHEDVADSLAMVARAQFQCNNLAEAREPSEQALAMRRRIYTSPAVKVARSLELKGFLLRFTPPGDVAGAEACFTEALAIYQSLTPPNLLAEAELIVLRSQLPAASDADTAAAEQALTRAVGLFEQLGGRDSSRFSAALHNQGLYRAKLNDPAGAEASYRRALEMRRRVFGDRKYETAVTAVHLAKLLQAQSRQRDALPLAKEAAAITAKLYPPDNERRIDAESLLESIQRGLEQKPVPGK